MNRRTQMSLLLLAGASGAVDALAFTVLGTVFAGVMTGNLVLLGVAVGHLGHGSGSGEGMSAPLYALGGYVAGAALVAFLCRGAARCPEWPGRVVACLAAQGVLLAGVAVVAGVCDGRPDAVGRTVLLVVAAVSMGGQSAAMVAAGSGAAPTTYFTGTLTTLVTGFADGSRREGGQPWVAARLLAVVGGAVCAVAVHTAAPAWGFVPPALFTAAAVACHKPAQRLRRAVTPVHKNPLHGTNNETH
ncbi:YoaK family protein [Streptomyces sp. NPDC050264]|uniref:YoaK family protein n=1 Tax=Streptomyces sp. NPDC050264 TaxID=3155038 RepID=UPI00344349B2